MFADPSTLERTIRQAEPAALFVEPRILRRVIKQDRRLTGIGFQAPHARVYTIERERLLVIADRPELNLSPAAELPPRVILLPRPADDESLKPLTDAEALHTYWRLLFHARIHIAIEERIADRILDEAEIARRIQRIGAVEFVEIRTVLVRDELLPPAHSDVDAYVEFMALSLELRYFTPDDRPLFFPAVRDWQAIDQLAGRDVPHATLYDATRPEGAPVVIERPDESRTADDDDSGVIPVETPSKSMRRYVRLVMGAERAARLGNHVKGAILRMRAARIASSEHRPQVIAIAVHDLHMLAHRLADMWGLSEVEEAGWRAALLPLIQPAAAGYRSVEARLLYDLQKAAIAHEQGFFRVRLGAWLLSGGTRPLKQSLPILQQVLVVKNLRTAARRVPTVRLIPDDRRRLDAMLAGLVDDAETHLRERVRPIITGVLDDVGLVPSNVPENVSRQKLVEELLDRVVERGFVTMGDLRDGLSLNDLKLADVSGVLEPVFGDKLLRADTRLGRVLEGVYRPGAVYLRTPQRLSSLAFGTRLGRFLTEYVVLPFGGAFLAAEAVKHVVHAIAGEPHPAAAVPHVPRDTASLDTEPAQAASELTSSGAALPAPDSVVDAAVKGTAETIDAVTAAVNAPPAPDSTSAAVHATNSWEFYAAVLVLGVLMLLVMHRPAFRAWLIRAGARAWKLVRRLGEIPLELLNAPWMRRILESQTYGVLRSYLLRPAILTAMIGGLAWIGGSDWTRDFTLQVFLAANLFLNSPIGRYADEWLTDVLVRAWHELRIRVIAAAFQWVMDVFHRVMEWLERIIYTVDEWLRFRAGDRRFFFVVKLLLNPVWYVVAYVVRIFVTLLIEPQVNPIKHFPVVTVSHKLIIPFQPTFATLYETVFNRVMANTLAGITVLLLPGVFGFLVWELKGNWRLYAANRRRSLGQAPIGEHGETLAAFLRPGIHSGTLPKLFSRLRSSLRDGPWIEHDQTARRQLLALDHVRLSLRRFVDRTLGRLLTETGFCDGSPVSAGEIRLATNRIEIELIRPQGGDKSLWLRFDDVAGWLRAEVVSPGWLPELPFDQRRHFNSALSGFYKLCGVDVVREQLHARLVPPAARIEFQPEGLLLFSDPESEPEVHYTLSTTAARLAAEPVNGQITRTWPTLARSDLLFADVSIPWSEWVAAWTPPPATRSSPQDDEQLSTRLPTVIPV